MIKFDEDESLDIVSLRSTIHKLSTRVWESKVSEKIVQTWLNNFSEEGVLPTKELQDKIALYMLSRFLYFDDVLIREMLKTVYNNLFRRPIIRKIRQEHSGTLDYKVISKLFEEEQEKTRFLGMGNPSESGSHLLYSFRQVNELPTKLFMNTPENTMAEQILSHPEISRYIFLDDFCGTGSQGKRYSKEIVEWVKTLKPEIDIFYFPLISTSKGLTALQETQFNKVATVLVLDESFKCFSQSSRYFNSTTLPRLSNDITIKMDDVKDFCNHYGQVIMKSPSLKEKVEPLGYGDGQLLLGFHHNIPNNTLPIIWAETDAFEPIFPRHSKKYR